MSVFILLIVGILWLASKNGTGGFAAGTFSPVAPIAKTRMSLTSATTTVCALGPFASSTIQKFAMTITSGTSSPATFIIGTTTSPYATSTAANAIIASTTILANTQGTIRWTPSGNHGGIVPGEYLTVGTVGNPGVSYNYYTYGGSCQVLTSNDN